MRSTTNADKVRHLMAELGRRATGPGRVYLVGGATAVLFGWRETTIDVDLKLEPEPAGVFDAIQRLKEELDLNIELAAPDQFIPPVDGWQARSLPIATFGSVGFFHYDPVGQALAKIERGHTRDLADARQMLDRGLVSSEALERAFESIRARLKRYPAVDERAFEEKLRSFLASARGGQGVT